MNAKQKAKAIAGLSPRARKLWDRVNNDVHYYLWRPATDPLYLKSMNELVAAGLVTTMGRVTRINLCFVPVGTKPAQMEKFPS